MSGTPAESAITAMLRVHEGLNTLRLPNTPQVTLRISVGVALLNRQMSHYREWLKSADLALYKAKKAGRNRTEVAAYVRQKSSGFAEFLDFSIHFVIASITAARKPSSSSTRTASMVVPPGEQTISFSAPGCSPVSSTILRNPLPPSGKFIRLGAWHPAQHGGVGHRFDKHKYVGWRRTAHTDHRVDHRLSITSASPKQRKIFSTSAVSSGVTSAFGVTEVIRH